MVIEHKKQGTKGIFYIDYEGDVAAEMVYTTTPDNIMIIEHTEVGDELRGRNIGYELVHAGVEYARHHGYKVIPVCPFARSVFDKKPDFKDVLS